MPNQKNKVFRRKYVIEMKGVTTNEFMKRFIDSYIGGMFMALAERFASLEIRLMSAEEIATSAKADTVYRCPKCNAMKYTEGSDCLFCAVEESKHADN